MMIASRYQRITYSRVEKMCFTSSDYPANPPPSSIPRRRLTLNAGTEAITSLKRALNLGLFLAPTVIHLHGDGASKRRDIYLSAAIQRSLRKVYNDLRRGDLTLSRDKFKNFLETEQGELEAKTSELLTRGSYIRFEQFLEAWWIQFGLDIEKPVSNKDLTKPISNYFIDSSHNTYLPGKQWNGKATTETYRRALIQGCRCVEIDVWDNDQFPSSDELEPGSTKKASKSEHTRKISTSSLHTTAAYIKGAVDEKIEQTRQFLGVEKIHSGNMRCSKFDIPSQPQGNGNRLNPGNADVENIAERPPSSSKTVPPRNEPLVMHGYTFTQPIGFRQVCKAIREDAFKTTDLPIIVSLEVHARPDQQERMVQIMKEEWAGLLVERPHDACPNSRMPRLEELLRKILVKVKKASPTPEGYNTTHSLAPKIFVIDDDDTSSVSEDDRSIKRSQPKVPICKNLSDLAVYTHSEHFTNFDSASAKTSSHIFSINEKKILDLWESKRHDLFEHNKQFFMRAYPSGLRVNSSNLDPSQYWRKGVQMAAMNRQSWDEGMMLNKAMFSGENGWVLKPQRFRNCQESSNQTTRPAYRAFDLIITVLAGQHIPLPGDMPRHRASSLRPLVKCDLHIEKAEDRSDHPGEGGIKPRSIDLKKQTTSARTDHPEFDAQTRALAFTNIHRVEEQLSFVRNELSHAPFRQVATNPTQFL
ncbi:PLC-like phosphodiesterase [Xylaria nigripes]|nr:PLC-like phosphodiesterase [Xylaria nigripes]